MTRIFIENNELDLTQGLSNQLTYAIDDINNLDSKSTAFSKTIILPGTTKNNTLVVICFQTLDLRSLITTSLQQKLRT